MRAGDDNPRLAGNNLEHLPQGSPFGVQAKLARLPLYLQCRNRALQVHGAGGRRGGRRSRRIGGDLLRRRQRYVRWRTLNWHWEPSSTRPRYRRHCVRWRILDCAHGGVVRQNQEYAGEHNRKGPGSHLPECLHVQRSTELETRKWKLETRQSKLETSTHPKVETSRLCQSPRVSNFKFRISSFRTTAGSNEGGW